MGVNAKRQFDWPATDLRRLSVSVFQLTCDGNSSSSLALNNEIPMREITAFRLNLIYLSVQLIYIGANLRQISGIFVFFEQCVV